MAPDFPTTSVFFEKNRHCHILNAYIRVTDKSTESVGEPFLKEDNRHCEIFKLSEKMS